MELGRQLMGRNDIIESRSRRILRVVIGVRYYIAVLTITGVKDVGQWCLERNGSGFRSEESCENGNARIRMDSEPTTPE